MLQRYIGSSKWLRSDPCRPHTFHRRILSLHDILQNRGPLDSDSLLRDSPVSSLARSLPCELRIWLGQRRRTTRKEECPSQSSAREKKGRKKKSVQMIFGVYKLRLQREQKTARSEDQPAGRRSWHDLDVVVDEEVTLRARGCPQGVEHGE